MLLYLLMSLLTAATLVAVLRPLRRAVGGEEALDQESAVYRDQLRELEREVGRGEIGPEEAAAARAEIARRLLRVAAGEATAGAKASPHADRGPVMLAAALAVIAVAGGLYSVRGAPTLPDQPRTARLSAPPATDDLTVLIAKVEERLRQHPEDGEGWEVIAPVYLKIGRGADAADAFERAVRLQGESPARLEGFAEATILAANGIVGETARRALERVVALEPGRVKPRFWLAVAAEQEGKTDVAAASYRALLAEAPADAPWRQIVVERLAAVAPGSAAPAPASTGTQGRGPTPDDVAAASGMTAGERQQMIEGMVAGLAARLESDGKDVEGWLKLIRAYSVLGRRDEAAAALAKARSSLRGNVPALGQIDDLAQSLKLGT